MRTSYMLEDISYEYLKNLLEYNLQNGNFYRRYNCNQFKAGSIPGCISRDGYREIHIHGHSFLAHRLAWFYFYGVWPEKIDHINGNRLDNRIENLRSVSDRGNMQNLPLHRKGRLQGTRYEKRLRTNPWVARIEVNGARKHLGCFPTESEAHEAYLRACEEIS